jgi:hypothetical protein
MEIALLSLILSICKHHQFHTMSFAGYPFELPLKMPILTFPNQTPYLISYPLPFNGAASKMHWNMHKAMSWSFRIAATPE